MFERFSEKAIKVIMLAQEEARRLGHNFVGTEQILLGLIGEGTGIAAQCLKAAGVTLKDARLEVEKIIGRGSGYVAVEIPFTPRAKRLLEFSWDESRVLNHNYIGTEHLLLAMIREGEGVAPRVLNTLGVDLGLLRSRLLIVLLGPSQAGVGPLPTKPIIPDDIQALTLTGSCLPWYSLDAVGLIKRAANAAKLTGSKDICLEHLVLGLIQNSDTIASALQSANISAGQIRQEIFKTLVGGDGGDSTPLPFNAEAKDALERAWLEAVTLSQNLVTQECICLGLLNQPEGTLPKLLETLKANPDVVRQSLIDSCKTAPQAKAAISQAAGDTQPAGFTENALKVIECAQEEARRLGRNYVGHEQILLGLIAQSTDKSGEALKDCGIDLETTRGEVENHIGRGSADCGAHIPFSQQGADLIAKSGSIARRLGDGRVDSVHLLLGLLNEQSSIALTVLKYFNVTPAALEEKVLTALAAEKSLPLQELQSKLRPGARSTSSATSNSQHASAASSTADSPQNANAASSATDNPQNAKAASSAADNPQNANAAPSAADNPQNVSRSPGSVGNQQSFRAEPDERYRLPLQRMTPFNPTTLPLLTIIVICVAMQGQLSSSGPHVNITFLAIAFAIIVGFAAFVSFMPGVGESMEPSILDGDVVIGERLTKILGRRFRRGEIVTFIVSKDVAQLISKEILALFEAPDLATCSKFVLLGGPAHLVTQKYFRFIFGLSLEKRVVGLPGDHIEITAGRIRINGEELTQPWASGRQYDLKTLNDIGIGNYRPFADNHAPIIVPPRHYFVLGDNRSINNLDSHIIGFINKKSIAERVCCIFSRRGQLHFKLLRSDEEFSTPSPANDVRPDPALSGLNKPLSMPQIVFDWLTDEAVRRAALLLAFLVVPFALINWKYHSSQTEFEDLTKQMNTIHMTDKQR